jgi:hypothetical protein
MNDHRACATIFINIQAMECWLKEGWWIEIIRRQGREHCGIDAWLHAPHSAQRGFCYLPDILLLHTETKRVMSEEITAEQLIADLWKHRIPDEAKRTNILK